MRGHCQRAQKINSRCSVRSVVFASMSLTFRRFIAADVADADSLVSFLTAEPWPFHATAVVDEAKARGRIADGDFDGDVSRAFWIVDGAETAGLVNLYDLGDLSPMFDIRIRAGHRRRGLGTQTVRWLTEYLFTELPDIRRIEANTRKDNVAMRRTFLRCGYVKESHYREAWPSYTEGTVHDGVGYAILRRDWVSGTTTLPDWDDEPARPARRPWWVAALALALASTRQAPGQIIVVVP